MPQPPTDTPTDGHLPVHERTTGMRHLAENRRMNPRPQSIRPGVRLRPTGFHLQCGITLIELMIVVAVVAILAAIAYPSYQDQIRKSRRSAAQSVLMDAAQKEHQLFLDVRSYSAAADTAALQGAPLRVAVPGNVATFYAFSIAVATPAGLPPTFTATAVPQGGQTADACGSMTVNQLGAKTAALSSGCW